MYETRKAGTWNDFHLCAGMGRTIQLLVRFHTHPKLLPHPAGALSIRGAEEEKYAVIDVGNPEFGVKGHILEETEVSRALFELYEGAIVSQGF